MKKFFFSLIAFAIATVSFAQTSLVATLTHGDEISMYYGAFAFRDAHAAAANGDVINLSGGGFQAVDITKAITVRGTGINDSNPTNIINDFSINIPSDVTERLSFEGCRFANTIMVYGTLANAYFLKSRIERIYVYSYDGAQMINGMFVNCEVLDMTLYGKSTVQFLNSHVEGFRNYDEANATASFINCVIIPDGGWGADQLRSSQLANCILYWTNGNLRSLPITSQAINCVAVGNGSGDAFSQIGTKQNCQYAGMDIFQDSDVWKDLTDEAKAKYIGMDGTPIGMYGGALPYDMTPSYPQITKMNVASKTTADGKLSVEIEVSAAQ